MGMRLTLFSVCISKMQTEREKKIETKQAKGNDDDDDELEPFNWVTRPCYISPDVVCLIGGKTRRNRN